MRISIVAMMLMLAVLVFGTGSAQAGLGDNEVCLPASYLTRIETGGSYSVGDVLTSGAFSITVTSVNDEGEITGFTASGPYSFIVIHAGGGQDTFSDPTGPFRHGLSFVAFCGDNPTPTHTATETATSTATSTETATSTATETNTATATSTATSTATATSTGTVTIPTVTHTATATDTPQNTPTSTVTNETPTQVSSPTHTPSVVPSASSEPTEVSTPVTTIEVHELPDTGTGTEALEPDVLPVLIVSILIATFIGFIVGRFSIRK